MIAISRALGARGNPTLIASHGGPYEHLLDEAGIQWERLEPAMGPTESQAFLDGLLSIAKGDKPMYSDDYIRAAVRAEAAWFSRVGAVLAVTGFNLTTYVSSRVAKIPIATSHGGSFVPPVLDRGLCPIPVNPTEPKMKRLPRFVQRWLANNVPRWLKASVRDLGRIADEFGVQKLPSFMALMCGDLTLVTEIPEVLGISRIDLESWRPWRRKLWPSTTFRYTGPLFAQLERPVPTRVDEFLRGEEPIVYLAPTSVPSEFLRELICAVSAAGVRVLVGATIHDVRELETDRIMIEGILPNHVIMERVSACVIMGGQGSVQTAMKCGTPFVGMPYHGEQELNVAIAETQGLAIRLSPFVGGTARMTDAVKRLLTVPSFRGNAQRMKAQYAGVDGADGCARAIIDYLGIRGHASPARKSSSN